MSVWKRLTSGGGPRRTVGVCVDAGGSGARRAGLDGERLLASAPNDFASDVSVAAVSDAGTLLRRLSLPPAKPAVTDRLVRQQVAALLPGMDAQLALAWRRDPRSGDVTVAAGPHAALRAASDAAELRGGDLRVPFGLALDALFSRGASDGDAPAAWAVDCGPMTWLLLYAGGGLVAADTVGPGESVGAVFADLVAGLPPERRPTRLTGVGRDGTPPGSEPGGVSEAASDFPAATGWTGGHDSATWLAAGAALVGRQARDAEGLDFTEAVAAGGSASVSASERRARRTGRLADGPSVSGRRWAVVGLWLLAALGFWAWAVASGGARQTAVVDELGLSRAAIPGLDRGLAVGRYLETSGPSLLAVMDELGQKTGGGKGEKAGGWMLDEIVWERDTGLTLRGTLGSADTLAELARSMATMRTLTGVQVRRQAPEGDDQVSYTIVASPSSTWYGSFVEPRGADGKTPEESSDAVAVDGEDDGFETEDAE